MLTSRCLLGLALGLLSAGCAGAPPPRPLSALPPGTTTLRIENHVAPPGQLDHVSVVVDGIPVSLSSVPPPGAPAATLGSLALPPGPHSVTVRARAHAHTGEVLVVGAQQPFYVARGPAILGIDVRSPLPGDAGAPVAVKLAMEGGRMAPDFGAPPADDKDARCAGLLPIHRAICSASVDLEEATRRNDVVTSLCVRDHLAEMRRIALVGDVGRPESTAAAEARIAAVARKVDLCGGVPATALLPDGVTITRVGTR